MKKILLLVMLLLCGCEEAMQPERHPEFGQKWMKVPAGTKIGNEITEKDGMYFREDVPLDIFVFPQGMLDMLKEQQDEKDSDTGLHKIHADRSYQKAGSS